MSKNIFFKQETIGAKKNIVEPYIKEKLPTLLTITMIFRKFHQGLKNVGSF
jgi:hypothetical protein